MAINIAYSSSNAYAKCTGISILSLLHNNTDEETINIYVYTTDMADNNKAKLKEITDKYKREIKIVDISKQLELIASQFGFESMRGSYNTFVRLFVSHWLDDIDRVLFIDSDTLILGLVSDYYYVDMDDNMLAAVPDAGIYERDSQVEDIEIINKGEKYINAGVVLLNLKLWRQENADMLIADRIKEYKKEWLNSEQSVFNYAFYNRCKYIHLSYNYYTTFHFEEYEKILKHLELDRVISKEEYIEAKNAPIIIHFVGLPYVRPWYNKNISPYKEVYLNYYKMSPWCTEALENFPRNPQFSYRIYDYILYVAQKHKLYTFHNMIRTIFGGKLKQLFRSIVGGRK